MQAIVPKPKSLATCPICGTAADPIEVIPPTTYYGCEVCNTHFQFPMPTIDQMRDYVQKEYASGVYNDYVAAAKLKALTFGRRAKIVRTKMPESGRLLDIGASCGFFVEQALAVGFDAYGVEISTEAVSKAPEEIRARLTIGDVNTLEIEGNVFDVVTAFDVIEHVFDPVSFLRSLRTIVRSGSLLAITTPDTNHFLRSILRRRWPMYQPMQHTVLFSKRGLRLALSQAGYEKIEIGPATKTLTADYLAGQIEMYLPLLVRGYNAAAKIVPKNLRNAPVNVNIGELMAFARVP